jgi:hypothetical protein
VAVLLGTGVGVAVAVLVGNGDGVEVDGSSGIVTVALAMLLSRLVSVSAALHTSEMSSVLPATAGTPVPLLNWVCVPAVITGDMMPDQGDPPTDALKLTLVALLGPKLAQEMVYKTGSPATA